MSNINVTATPLGRRHWEVTVTKDGWDKLCWYEFFGSKRATRREVMRRLDLELERVRD